MKGKHAIHVVKIAQATRWLFGLLLSLSFSTFPLSSHVPGTASAQTKPVTIGHIVWSLDGDQFAVGYSDGTLEIRDAAGNIEQTLSGHSHYITAVAWHPTADQLISGSFEELFWWDLSTGEPFDLKSVHDFGYNVRSVSWNFDASQIMVFTDSPLQIWDAQTTPPHFLSERYNDVPMRRIAWRSDRSQVATTGLGDVVIRDPITFARLSWVENGGIGSLAWSPDGNQLATSDWVGRIQIWDMSTKTPEPLLERTLQDAIFEMPEYLTTDIKALQFSPSGTELYSVGGDGTYTRWNASTGEVLETYLLTDTPIYAAAFSPDSNQLIYGTEDAAPVIIDVEAGPPHGSQE